MIKESSQLVLLNSTLNTSHEQKRDSHGSSGLINLLIAVITLLLGFVSLQQNHNWLDDSMEMDRLMEEIALLEDEVESLHHEIPQLYSEMESKMRCSNPESPLDDSHEEDISSRVSAEIILKEEIANQARRSTLHRYGKGTYKVEMQLEFPPDSKSLGHREKIVIEMAPLEMMPYAVSFFLDRVAEGFYDGHAFNVNAGHVMIATASENKDHTVVNTAFQEHNPQYPHSHYTLGFTTKERGNNFYISTDDNSIYHGINRETCFAKVVEGFDTVDRLSTMQTEDDNFGLLTTFATITNAIILTEDASTD